MGLYTRFPIRERDEFQNGHNGNSLAAARSNWPQSCR
jgi:hypothetical protein